MDRDKRWERVKLAYDALVNGTGIHTQNPLEAIEHSYADNITDEFIKPIITIGPGWQPHCSNQRMDDAVLCFNFRTDRCREITEVLTQKDMPEFGMKKLSLELYNDD